MIWCSSGETRVTTLCQTEHLERKPPGLALELRTVWRAGSLAGPQPGQPRRIPGATRNEKREPLGHTRLAELTRATAGETGTNRGLPLTCGPSAGGLCHGRIVGRPPKGSKGLVAWPVGEWISTSTGQDSPMPREKQRGEDYIVWCSC
jgi:hypothetical protein